YTLTATVTDAELGAELVLEDTLGAGLAFGSVTAPGPFTSNTAGNPLVFTLASGTPPGVYAVSYTATVTASSGTVGNNVVISGGGGDPTPDCGSCTTSHPLGDPNIILEKVVESYTATGPGRYRVTYRIGLSNTESFATAYTLLDTLDFPISGISFDAAATVSTTSGIVNPALAGGSYTPVNGAAQQISASSTPI